MPLSCRLCLQVLIVLIVIHPAVDKNCFELEQVNKVIDLCHYKLWFETLNICTDLSEFCHLSPQMLDMNFQKYQGQVLSVNCQLPRDQLYWQYPDPDFQGFASRRDKIWDYKQDY